MVCELHGYRLSEHERYTRRVFANGTIHYCIQNTLTLDLVKHPRHEHRPFIRHDEIPPGETVYNWLDVNQGWLFDE